jgi:hypothetical protein
MGNLWHSYWAWTGGNIGALPLEMPLEAALAAVFAVIFRKPLGRFIRWLSREEKTAWSDVLRAAEAAQRISADLYEHRTGRRHPDAPDSETEAK